MAQTDTGSGTLVGYFENKSSAERAVSALQDAGFTSAHLGVAHREDTGDSSARAASAASSTAHAAAGKAEGMWDKVKNFFEGGDVEPYADEKRAGDLASREVTPGGYDPNEFGGTLNAMSVPEDRSRYFSHRFQSGDEGVLVTVSAPGRESEAEAILRANGADLGDASTQYNYAEQPNRTATEGTQKIQLLGEVLRVHKDRVSRGEVTLRKEVTTEMQTVQVPVTREELVIERHAVTGGTTPTGAIGETGEIRIPLTEERASVDKSTFVREEVSVGKRAVEDVRELSDQVRSEELIVDDATKDVLKQR